MFTIKDGKIDFAQFTYSQNHHIGFFIKHNYEQELFGKVVDPSAWGLKRYQDLLVFAFIKRFIPEGSRLLDVGGGKSRIINHFKSKYECWNVDKLEGLGQGPTQINNEGFHLVKDYMGNFNPELPDDYFDFIFSISALEHVKGKDTLLHKEILSDLNRVMKSGCYSLHCFDSILRSDGLWTNGLLTFIFQNEKTINQFVPYSELSRIKNLFVLPESKYNKNWFPRNHKTYDEYGKPFSYNILWRKE